MEVDRLHLSISHSSASILAVIFEDCVVQQWVISWETLAMSPEFKQTLAAGLIQAEAWTKRRVNGPIHDTKA